MKAIQLPSLAYLSECFTLSVESCSGLTWNRRPPHHFLTQRGWSTFNSQRAGKTAGALASNAKGRQYYVVGICGVLYKVHRVIYALHHTIDLPLDIEIDHRDNEGTNNSPENLRLATHPENNHNTLLRSSNKSGVKGVHWHKASNAWKAEIMVSGCKYHLGTSPSIDVLEHIIKEFRLKLHKEFSNHG